MSSFTIPGPAGTLHFVSLPAPPAASREEIPALFVHGMVGYTGFWDHALAHTARRRRAIALDLRGHGRSAPPADGDYSVERCADDAAAVLDALGLARVALVGHSYGALVALELAARRPTRVARLVLADPPGDITRIPPEVRERELAPFIAALAGDDWRGTITTGFEQALAGAPATTREIVLGRLAATPRDRLLGMYRGMFVYEAVRALDAYLAAPGRRARGIVAPSNAWPFSLHLLRPALETTVLPHVGHWLALDAPAPFAHALDEALGEGPAPS